jgi:mannosyl-glycoprotein endo-beta-N-acetylglucosaminidase
MGAWDYTYNHMNTGGTNKHTHSVSHTSHSSQSKTRPTAGKTPQSSPITQNNTTHTQRDTTHAKKKKKKKNTMSMALLSLLPSEVVLAKNHHSIVLPCARAFQHRTDSEPLSTAAAAMITFQCTLFSTQSEHDPWVCGKDIVLMELCGGDYVKFPLIRLYWSSLERGLVLATVDSQQPDGDSKSDSQSDEYTMRSAAHEHALHVPLQTELIVTILIGTDTESDIDESFASLDIRHAVMHDSSDSHSHSHSQSESESESNHVIAQHRIGTSVPLALILSTCDDTTLRFGHPHLHAVVRGVCAGYQPTCSQPESDDRKQTLLQLSNHYPLQTLATFKPETLQSWLQPARSYPLRSVSMMQKWTSGYDPMNRATVPFPHPYETSHTFFKKRRTLHCHDMMGGYVEDYEPQCRWLTDKHAKVYCFEHWNVIDIFIYFSHERFAIPPPGWIDAAHRNGVRVLATFITEWDAGVHDNSELVNNIELNVAQMVDIAEYYGFDGWFLNIEAPTATPEDAIKMVKFVHDLTEKMHERLPHSLVMWYDSLDVHSGQIRWQRALNQHNYSFYDACDSIFLDYRWSKQSLSGSHDAAESHEPDIQARSICQAAGVDPPFHFPGDGTRPHRIFVGVDVWGRGTPFGGGFSSCHAVDIIRDMGMSVALFAPAWTYENQSSGRNHDYFEIMERLFWHGLNCSTNAFGDSKSEIQAAWTTSGGGDGWDVIDDGMVSSFDWCTRDRLLDLYEAKGMAPGSSVQQCLSSDDLHSCPEIFVQQRIRGTAPDCEDFYQLQVQLLTPDHKVVSTFETDVLTAPASGAWTTISHTFANYKSNVRFVRWSDRAKSKEYWAGHYGTVLGDSSIIVSLDRVHNVTADSKSKLSPTRSISVAHLPFVHHFNRGFGRRMFSQGQLVRDDRWFQLSQQQPTTLLHGQRVFGASVTSKSGQTVAHVGFDSSVAYDGGNCVHIKVEGGHKKGDGAVFSLLRLRTAQVQQASRIRTVIKSTDQDSQGGVLGISLNTRGDENSACICMCVDMKQPLNAVDLNSVPVTSTSVHTPSSIDILPTGWTVYEFVIDDPLIMDESKDVDIGVVVMCGAQEFHAHIGEVAIDDNGTTVSHSLASSSITIHGRLLVHPGSTKHSLLLSWNEPTSGSGSASILSNVACYDLWREEKNGKTDWIGRTFRSTYLAREFVDMNNYRTRTTCIVVQPRYHDGSHCAMEQSPTFHIADLFQ